MPGIALPGCQGAEVGQNLIRMGARVGDLVDLRDHASGIDEERDALGVVRVLLVRALLDAIEPSDGSIDVAQQRVAEAVFVCERPVFFLRVEARAEDRCAERFELWASITEALSLTRSAAGGGLWKPPQHDPRAP